MRALIRRVALLVVAACGCAETASPLFSAQLDVQRISVPEQRSIDARLEQVLETSPSNREVVVRTPKGGVASIVPRAAISKATGGPCGDCEDQCRPFRYQYQAIGESVFPIVEGVRCRQPSGRWSLVQERIVGSLDIRAVTSQPDAGRTEEQRRADERRRADEQRQEMARLDAARQEAVRQDNARQEAVRQEAIRQDAARQEAARQDAARQDSARQEALRLEYRRLDELRADLARQAAESQERARQEAARQDTARQEDAAHQEAFRREAALQDAARAENARQNEKRRREEASLEAKRQADDVALRSALVRMRYMKDGAGPAEMETAVGAFLTDHKYPLSTPRDRILELARRELPSFELVRPCKAAGADLICRE